MLFCSFSVVFVFGRFSWSVEKNLGIGCGYDLSFGDEYKLFKSSNPVCRGKFVRFMVVRFEYDRSNRVCIRTTGNRPSHAVAQGAVFLYRAKRRHQPAQRTVLGQVNDCFIHCEVVGSRIALDEFV